MTREQADALRSVVQDSLGKHLYQNAIFFADKLVAITHAEDDVYRLVQAYLFTQQHRRALHVLRTMNLATSSTRFRYLTAKCLAECQEWDECLATLDDTVLEHAAQEAAAEAAAAGGGGVRRRRRRRRRGIGRLGWRRGRLLRGEGGHGGPPGGEVAL